SRTTLPRNRAEPDIAAIEAAGPTYAVDRGIGTRLRLGDRAPERRHVEHATAIRENSVAVRLCAGMEDLDAFDRRGDVEALDQGALGVASGITLRRHHHRQSCVRVPA